MTKRILSLALFVSLATVNIGLIIANFRPAGAMFGPNNSFMQGLDMSMRRNEATCVRNGINPFDVWSGKIDLPPYFPFINDSTPKSKTHTEPINAYTPWEYTLMLPFSFIPKQPLWWIHNALMYLSLFLISFLAFKIVRKVSTDVSDARLAAALPLLLFIPINIDMNVGNYALMITAASLAMAVALNRRKDTLASLLWTFAMIKPQLALLFAIPLLIKGKTKVCLIAGSICILASIPPAILCHESPITLILQAPKASAHAFTGCALMPQELLLFLRNSLHLWEPVLWGLPMLAGLTFCIYITWRLRKSNDWILLLTPAVLTAVSWTYVQGHSYLLCAIVIIAMTVDTVRHPTHGNILLCAAAILLMARMGRAFEIVVNAVLPALNSFAAIVRSWSSTAAFVLVFIWLMSLPRSSNASA